MYKIHTWCQLLVFPKDTVTTFGLLKSSLAFPSSLGKFSIQSHVVVPLCLLKLFNFLIRDLLSPCRLVADMANLFPQGLLQMSSLHSCFLLSLLLLINCKMPAAVNPRGCPSLQPGYSKYSLCFTSLLWLRSVLLWRHSASLGGNVTLLQSRTAYEFSFIGQKHRSPSIYTFLSNGETFGSHFNFMIAFNPHLFQLSSTQNT